MKNIMIIGLLAFVSGNISANSQQDVNTANEKVLIAKEVVKVQKIHTEEIKELPKELKPIAVPLIATDKES